MQQEQPLHALCFVKRAVSPVFTGENSPRLAYASKILPKARPAHTRVMHAHPDLVELLLIYSGGSECLIGDKRRTVHQGDLLIYNSGVIHDEWSWPEDAVGHYCVGISGLRMPGLRENALIPDSQDCVFPSGSSFGTLCMLFETIFQSLSANEPQAELFCHSLMEALVVKVLAVLSGAEASPAEPPDVLGKRIQEYIDAHYMEPLTLQSMGDALHISPYYLSHVFKKTLGYSPTQYLLRRRIGEAQTLLLSTGLPVGRIGELVGYDTQSYFVQQFTKAVGMPPRRYRQEFVVPPKENGEGGSGQR